ncbi:MAG: putative sugar-binding proteinputative S-layer protein, partial [Eubacterium sp.]|nr:putative sugar-binding proteinputative S-layer protein [Eubacterium sp.]
TLIIKDNTFLHVGENGYDRLFSHDTIGILQSLITAGDFKDAKNYLESVPMTGGINIENGKVDPDLYWDANWKLPWAYSVYLSKTGDLDYIKAKFEGVIKKMAHSIHDDRTGAKHDGIMKSTLAIDSYGQWTVDDQAALMGLIAYKYICNELAIKETDQSKKDYYLAEVQWANAEYDSLLKVVTETLENTINSNNLNYIPASIVEPNTKNRCDDIRDANWASMLLFGSFPWDGYLYGADQTKAGANIDMIDQTYAYGIDRRKNLPEASPYNFGGYPHGFYSSAYNAGYGIAALRGEAYRDMGIKAYEFQINSAMGSPFGWWEGVGPTDFSARVPDPSTPLWNRDNAAGGGGSNQHMWGQATASKVLYDALIAERIFNDNKNAEIIIGRGVPKEWVTNATRENNIVAAVENYPVLQGGRAGYTIERNGSKLKITMNCNKENSKVDVNTVEQWSIQLPSMVNNISSVSAGEVDNAKGIVTVPIETKEITIVLKDLLASSVSIYTTLLSNGKVGAAYSSALAATGGTLPYTWSAEGLPTGLSITNKGVIEGTPTAAGTFSVTLKVQDNSNPVLSDSKTLSITIASADDPGSPVSIDTASLPNGKVGTAYSSALAATGGTLPYTWSAEGLPTGLSITNAGVIEGTPSASGTFNVTLKVKDSSNPALSGSRALSIIIAPADQQHTGGGNGGSDNGGSSGSNTGNTGTTVNPIGSATSGDNTILTVTIKASSVSGQTVANIDKATIHNLAEKAKEAEKNGQNAIIEIKLDSANNAKSFEIGLPADALKEIAGTVGTEIKVSTGIGSVILNAKAIDSISASAASGNINIIIKKTENSLLPEEIKAKVSDRPVYNFSVQAGDKVISELDGGTARVSIPYTPKPNEKYNSIIIYKIDNDGNSIVVRSIYNPVTGTVDFITTNSSQYAVGYNEVKFNDVTSKDWFDKAVGFMSARGIVNGIGDGSFAPQNKVTRADFLIMVMNAYGIEVDSAVTGNFADAGSKYYSDYLGTAKRMGLVSGTGDNKFTPNATISRQDMLVILYRVLDVLGELPAAKTGNFDSFSDSKDISGYAKDTMRVFVEAGIVSGDKNKLNPKTDTSRAEAVQVLYNLLSR